MRFTSGHASTTSTGPTRLVRYVVPVVLGTGGSQDLGIPGIFDAELVGSGGSARVYRAVQGQLGRTVAVKVLTGTAPQERKQFDRESKALGQLSSHPGIVSVFDAGLTNNEDPYLVLEYCAGGSLSQRLEHGVLTWQEAAGYLAPVAETLAQAHERGYVHRDIKPGNILIDGQGRSLIADFGLARLIDADASLAQASIAAFTPGYVPPETISGAPSSRASDVYSLGCTLYSLLTGLVPFVDTETKLNIVALARRVAEDPVPDLRIEGIPDQICEIIEQSMAKDPAQRPTALEMAQQLHAAVGSTATAPASNPLPAGIESSAEVEPADATDATEPAPKNSTIHLSADDLAAPVDIVAPDVLESNAAAAAAAVAAAQAAPPPAFDPGPQKTSRFGRRKNQPQAAPVVAAVAAPPSAPASVAPTAPQVASPRYQQPQQQYQAQGAGLPGAMAGPPAKKLRRTRALLMGVTLGLLILGLMILGVIGYYLIRGEDLPSISLERNAFVSYRL